MVFQANHDSRWPTPCRSSWGDAFSGLISGVTGSESMGATGFEIVGNPLPSCHWNVCSTTTFSSLNICYQQRKNTTIGSCLEMMTLTKTHTKWHNHYRRKFRSETSDNMDSWKAEVRRVRREKIRREKIRRERVRRKKMQMSKSRLAKAAGAEPAGQMRDEKVHAVVARSTFPSQNVQNTPASDHFCTLRCRKSARRCGAKHICKSKCTKHTRFGPLLYVAMSKKCAPLWRGAHFQVKMYKTHQCRTTFGSCDVEKVHAVVARSTFPSQKC